MLASFTDLQTGQEPRKASQDLHEQRCLQGRKITHEVLELHPLQATFFWLSTCSISHEPQQKDSASWTLLLGVTSRSLIRSSVLLKSTTTASFSLASLCHCSLSCSTFLRQTSSSMVFFVVCAKSSSFCLIKEETFDSTLFSMIPNCCFLCCCKANLSLSACICFREIDLDFWRPKHKMKATKTKAYRIKITNRQQKPNLRRR